VEQLSIKDALSVQIDRLSLSLLFRSLIAPQVCRYPKVDRKSCDRNNISKWAVNGPLDFLAQSEQDLWEEHAVPVFLIVFIRHMCTYFRQIQWTIILNEKVNDGGKNGLVQ